MVRSLLLAALAPLAAAEPSLNARNLEPFIGGLVEKEMAACRVPGAVVAVEKDGATTFAKGYGFANLELQVPASADRTRFCLTSITKTFTATAVPIG